MRGNGDGVQVSLVQLDNYGPWTVTPTPRREMDLQSLQARLYADFAEFVGERDGYAFFERFDNMVAVTNGIGERAHARFQERVRNHYPVTVSVGVGAEPTPVEALGAASRRLQAAGSAQDPERTEVLAAGEADADVRGDVTIAHFDVVNVTGTYTDRRNVADATLAMRSATVALAAFLRDEHGAVARFVGGDNVIAVCPPVGTDALDAARAHVRDRAGVDLQVGVGRGTTARAAGHRAKLALEQCRESGTRVHHAEQHAPTD